MAHSLDLRRRAVEAYHDGEGTYAELAERFKIGSASLQRWVKLESETGSLEPRTGNNGRPLSLTEEEQSILKMLLNNSPDSTDEELASALEMVLGKPIQRTMVNRYWHRWGYTRKKNRLWPPSSAPTASTQ